MKIKKGDKIYPIITGDDVVITKGVNHSGKTVDVALEEVDETLDEHKKEIDKLKSNVKYIYSYGGVGGTGRGGSGGGGGSTGTATLFISLGGHQLQNGGNTIILNSPKTYTVEGSLSNSNGETFFVTVGVGNKIDYPDTFKLNTELNRCKFTTAYNLKTNGEIVVMLYDSEYTPITSIRQNYIVKPHTYDMKFKYEFDSGSTIHEGEFDASNEYFIGDTTYRNPFIDVAFKIDLPNVTNVSVTYSIGDTTDGQGIEQFGSTTDISNNHFKIYLDQLHRKGKQFTDESNTGTYTVTTTLNYSVNGNPADPTTKTFKITLIPNYLYINVRNPQDLLYDTLDALIDAINEGVEGIPEKNVNVSTYVSFYCKIYEGSIKTDKQLYPLNFKSFDMIEDSDSEEYEFYDDPSLEENRTGIIEQTEMVKPISVAFETPGIKKLVFTTVGQKTYYHDDEKPVVKYIFVKKLTGKIDWFPNEIPHNDYYFKANSGSDTYSSHFPIFEKSGRTPFEISETDSPVTLTDSVWSNPAAGCDTTILSLGMQYSVVNNDGAKILETYASGASGYSQVADVVLYSDKLFSDNSKKICIPTESNFDKSVNSQYHLVQIVRAYVGVNNNMRRQYASYLYIDGKLESNKPSLNDNQLYIGKIVLNNVNAIYNLINVQYLNLGEPSNPETKHTIDGFIYQYWLAYKTHMMHIEPSEAEVAIFKNLSDIKFDGTNVIVPSSFVTTVSPHMPVPTMMMEYTGTDTEAFLRNLFKGYPNGDDSFREKPILLYWCDGLKPGAETKLKEIIIPNVTDKETGDVYSGNWLVKLQGTSTMKNRIKNFSLVTNTLNATGDKSILMSPNYDENDPSTFLPEKIWTLKADIADSAHANNTSVGKFVNDTCTKFSNGLTLDQRVKPFIKNTLEGFPVLMYFKVGEDVYYLGVYNFNMGRDSYYNLGYHTSNDMIAMMNNIESSGETSFSYSVGADRIISTLAIGEIQENFAQFDFHQYDDSVLFQPDDSSITRMFGKDEKITGADKGLAKGTLKNFVKSVSIAGAYCFANIGKTPKSSRGTNDDCVDSYTVEKVPGQDHKFIEYVPDIKYQFHYEGSIRVWEEKEDITFDNIRGNIEKLLQCISKNDQYGDPQEDYDYLDFSSASEYYTICMAFGLVDSVLKNMNIKSWDGKKCYVAFYDMDCALGENNSGAENVSYLAATDFWHSNSDNGYVEPVDINYDYWDESVGKGFDYPSSYLFAIVKYAKAILNKKNVGLSLSNYPQQFWAKLRNPDDGALRDANWFIDNYFSSGIGEIPAYLASLNYQVKYLYKGTIIDANGNETEVRYLANESAFNGTRIEKVKEWLRKRLHFLDVMFNVQGISIDIGGGYTIPLADSTLLNNLSRNSDIVVLSDAFSTLDARQALMTSTDIPVDVYAPMNTPFIINRGTNNEIFLLCAGTDRPNSIRVNVKQAEGYRFLGSKEFTNLSMVEPFLTSAYQIVSNNIEEIKYGGRDVPPTDLPLSITSTSVKNIKLDIPTLTGSLIIDNSGLNGQAVHTLSVARSGLVGTWSSLRNLQSLNISSVNSQNGTITVSDCPLVGDRCSISGTEDNPTTLKALRMTGVSGKFTLKNTKIQTINFDAAIGSDASFEINGDTLLTELTLSGFKSVVIRGCPNIKNLMITDINKVCEKIIIDIPEYTNLDGTPQNILKKFNSDTDGVFDFTTYTSLKTLGVSGCQGVEVIKIPNHKVTIDTFKNNKNLQFIDTVGKNSIIELTQDSTFWDCPCYGMKQSWATDGATDHNKNLKSLTSKTYTYTSLKNTKMCVSVDCTTLSHSFDKLDSSIKSKYINTPYVNEWGQSVKNGLMTIQEAAYFINACTGNQSIDDAYLTYVDAETTTIYDRMESKQISVWVEDDTIADRRGNITSLNGCFNKQSGIIYNNSTAKTATNIPDLSYYTALNDIAQMYYGTEVKFLTERLLNLPDSRNTNDPENLLYWAEFNGSGDLRIALDAFKHISYRISGLSVMTLQVYDPDDYTSVLCNGNEEPSDENKLNIVDVLCPQEDPEKPGKYIPFTRITSMSSFAINSSQWVDYTKLFEICPNVETLSSFLNCDLSKAKIDGILYPCTKLTSIVDSFNHTGSMNTLTHAVDLFSFFNWTDETMWGRITNLFSSTGTNVPGFSIKKVINHADFVTIMSILHNYQKIERLSNLFSFCTILTYNPNYEIKLSGMMNKVKNINSLFYECKSDDPETPLRIRRSFFENLPSVTSMANTFCGVYFDHMLSYDFFCKRIELRTDNSVFVKIDNEYKQATMKNFGYDSNALINNMYNCFGGAKFEKCKCWFDVEDGNQDLIPETDTVTYNSQTYTTYYKYEGGRYVEYHIIEPEQKTDTYNNFTNYVKNTGKIAGADDMINNHYIANDLTLYHNSTGNQYPYTENEYNIYPTYCCLPPDIFYACRYDCDLSYVFSDTNIIGVIPQHLLKNCYNSKLNDMFRNVNILPNLIYHYNSATAGDAGYKTLISNIPVDNQTITITTEDDTTVYTLVGSTDDDATVLFRDGDGVLKRRYPINGDEYDKSQFVYIPQGYASNSNLHEAFTFRYNLPSQVNMFRRELNEAGIIWPEGEWFGTEFSPEVRPELWPYYTQYFFMTDESLVWKNIANMNYPFITDGKDICFASTNEQRKARVFSSMDTNYSDGDRWWNERTIIGRGEWDNKTDGMFNVFLNLCCQRNVRTGKLIDFGCSLNIPMNNNNYPSFDGFVSGTLTALLNGRIFSAGTDAGRFTPTNGSSIIIYNLGFSRNIIFPSINYLPSGDISLMPRVALSYASETAWFYEFMFNDSLTLSRYKQIYSIPNGVLDTDRGVNKYRIIPVNQ